MRINRLICIAAIIGSGIFATYYGGNAVYALFYLTILIPIIAFLYTVYVYLRFRLYQEIGSRLITKGEWYDYSFVISNEDFITYRNIKVKFLSDKSTIEAANQVTEYCLLPNEMEKLQTRIKCHYRGEYYVGVNQVEITDFLNLFTITYPMASKIKAFVLPRVVQIEQLAIAPPQNDVKNPTRFSNDALEELDTEMRKYYPGDSRKRIHWKASARMGELISRKYQYIPKAQTIVFMDLVKIKDKELKVVGFEDKIIESVLAIVNFYAKRNIASHIFYDQGGLKSFPISSNDDFNVFYKACVTLCFEAALPVYEMINEKLAYTEEGMFYVVVTHMLSKDLYLAALKVLACQNSISIIYISDDVSDATRELINSMKLSGIGIYQIMSKDEITDILSK